VAGSPFQIRQRPVSPSALTALFHRSNSGLAGYGGFSVSHGECSPPPGSCLTASLGGRTRTHSATGRCLAFGVPQRVSAPDVSTPRTTPSAAREPKELDGDVASPRSKGETYGCPGRRSGRTAWDHISRAQPTHHSSPNGRPRHLARSLCLARSGDGYGLNYGMDSPCSSPGCPMA